MNRILKYTGVLTAMLPMLFLIGCSKGENNPADRAKISVDVFQEGVNVIVEVYVDYVDPAAVSECGIYWRSKANKEEIKLYPGNSNNVYSQGGKSKYRFEIFPWDGLVPEGKMYPTRCALCLQAYADMAGGSAYSDVFYDFFDTDVYPRVEDELDMAGDILVVPYKVVADSPAEVLEHGIYWNIGKGNGLHNYKKVKVGAGTGNFKAYVRDLDIKAGESFYCAAYVVTPQGTVYSQPDLCWLPGWDLTVSLSWTYSDVRYDRFTVSGECSVDNPVIYPVTERGFCYIEDRGPGIPPYEYDNKVTVEPGTGIYSATIAGLSPLTYYKVRAYARNGSSVVYSPTMITVRTDSKGNYLPSVGISSAVYSQGTSGVELSGEVLSDAGYDVIERGFCYSKSSAEPTVFDGKVPAAGQGVGPFSAMVTGLAAGRYYFRAYATNGAGAAYSSVSIQVEVP